VTVTVTLREIPVVTVVVVGTTVTVIVVMTAQVVAVVVVVTTQTVMAAAVMTMVGTTVRMGSLPLGPWPLLLPTWRDRPPRTASAPSNVDPTSCRTLRGTQQGVAASSLVPLPTTVILLWPQQSWGRS
jgi:hypothetical protein